MIPKLVIFDCDGVLVDTELTTSQVLVTNLRTYGLVLDLDDVHTLFTGGTMMSAGEEATRRGANLPANWVTEVGAAVNLELAKGVRVFDGVHDLLALLDAQGVHTAIASNGPIDKMRISLGPSGLFDHFDGRIHSGRQSNPKPAPDMLLRAAALANVAPDDAIMIDDTTAGTRAADAAGMRAIGFAAASDASSLIATGHPVARTMPDVQKLLGF